MPGRVQVVSVDRLGSRSRAAPTFGIQVVLDVSTRTHRIEERPRASHPTANQSAMFGFHGDRVEPLILATPVRSTGDGSRVQNTVVRSTDSAIGHHVSQAKSKDRMGSWKPNSATLPVHWFPDACWPDCALWRVLWPWEDGATAVSTLPAAELGTSRPTAPCYADFHDIGSTPWRETVNGCLSCTLILSSGTRKVRYLNIRRPTLHVTCNSRANNFKLAGRTVDSSSVRVQLLWLESRPYLLPVNSRSTSGKLSIMKLRCCVSKAILCGAPSLDFIDKDLRHSRRCDRVSHGCYVYSGRSSITGPLRTQLFTIAGLEPNHRPLESRLLPHISAILRWNWS
nr:hypothetical protein CFP56_09041 [Quercus suber]